MKLKQQLLENQMFPLASSSDLVVQELKSEVLIYNVKTNRAYCLNETSAAVWQACDGSRSVLEIAGVVSEKLNSFVNEDIVWLALEQLKKDELLIDCEDLFDDFGGLSRREMIRKAGLATMVALPLVSSLIAPTAAAAQSGAAVTCTKPTTSLFSLGLLSVLNIGNVAPFQCSSSADCCPPAPGCLLSGNACVEITIGNGIFLPLVDVNVCLNTGFICI